ncbi:hypothetical protein [Corynebacterium cystitidis]|uniref:hypothetical protein n=1 Tax=Corynebacterium cystitidis TaxID=35757 RepID=UPI001472AC10|nr:hypothetical protein [Corynebacterium cystitidis]
MHARADGLSSIAVVVGVIGVWLGFERADAIAGLLIAAVITMTMINSLALVVRRILDGVDPQAMHALKSAVAGVDGVEAVERVRARCRFQHRRHHSRGACRLAQCVQIEQSGS